MNSSWLEINTTAFKNNFQQLKDWMRTPIMPVVKGNAYGHGLAALLPTLKILCEGVCVFYPEEGLFIREWEKERGLQSPGLRILVLGNLNLEDILLYYNADLELMIPNLSWLKKAALYSFPKRLKVHLPIDTGLSREGFLPEELSPELLLALSSPCLHLKGIASHFSNTEDVTQHDYARYQLSVFLKAVDILEKAGFQDSELCRPLEKHFAASAPCLVLPEARFHFTRMGIALYGLWPSPETKLSVQVQTSQLPALTPVLEWKCRSQISRWIPEKSYIGYGCTYRCQRRTKIAVFPVGYSDGYPRLLSNKAYVLIDGQRCPVLGRVMMNYLIVDVTDLSEKETYLATLLGRDGEEFLPVETLAGWAETIHYELVTRLRPDLPRNIVQEGLSAQLPL